MLNENLKYIEDKYIFIAGDYWEQMKAMDLAEELLAFR